MSNTQLSNSTALRDETVLRRVRHLGSAREGLKEWRLQRWTALALIPLGLYFVISMLSLATSDALTAAAWLSSGAFILMHLACLGVLLTGANGLALALCGGVYLLQMFGITAGYHRYFSHRAYKTSRAFQLVLAVLGATCMQNGPIWWASAGCSLRRITWEESGLGALPNRSPFSPRGNARLEVGLSGLPFYPKSFPSSPKGKMTSALEG